MPSRTTLIVVSLALWVAAQDCVSGLVSLPLINTTLSNGKSRRGVSLKVGNPQQEFAFLPKWDNNNTFLYGPKCDSMQIMKSNDACITFRGGVYEDRSDSKGTLASSVKPPPDLWSSTTYDMFTETLDLGGNNSLRAFPLASPKDYKGWDTQGYDPQNIIGMGTGSTLMDACRKAGRIASDSSGFYWGLDGVLDSDQMKGSLVLGGYDKAKTYGNGRTLQLSDRRDCPTRMTVSINDIVLNFANGTDASVFPKDNGGTFLLACIIPERPSLMDMPRTPHFQNLLDAIGNEEWSRTVGVDWWNVVLNPSKPLFKGDLTFTLDDGFQVKIPNHQLIVPERYINDKGDLAVNSSRPVIRINSLQDTTAKVLPVLGRYFFTSAYVLLNRDANQFTLWQANPTSDENLVPVNQATQSCTTTPTTSRQPDLGGDQNGKLSSGAIAGIAVGGAAAAGIGLGVLWWCLVRRRKRNNEVEAERFTVEEERERPPTRKAAEVQWPSQGYPHFIPQEMSSQPMRNRPVELPTGMEAN
ncbi:Uncharacterized protein TPAR_07685 [Tolypocladium paradoxum]|uniref:Peptidase A1 domain-containing protein n=1 Tax=Tolypocladium paradoxum TaxID=94208 RepID=A0A2S4KPL0_9HYPO|nr:Uncharacterized protein TPAR_07685 [Tolypocladium paradoxum]